MRYDGGLNLRATADAGPARTYDNDVEDRDRRRMAWDLDHSASSKMRWVQRAPGSSGIILSSKRAETSAVSVKRPFTTRAT